MGCRAIPIYVGDTDENEAAYEAARCYEGRGYVGVRVVDDMDDTPLHVFATDDIERYLSSTHTDPNNALWYECACHRFVRQCVFDQMIQNYGYSRYVIDALFSNRYLIDTRMLQQSDLYDIGFIIEHTIDALNCQTLNPNSHTVLG